MFAHLQVHMQMENHYSSAHKGACLLYTSLVLYGCTYGLQGWNVSIQSSLHYASSIYNLTFLQMFFISAVSYTHLPTLRTLPMMVSQAPVLTAPDFWR